MKINRLSKLKSSFISLKKKREKVASTGRMNHNYTNYKRNVQEKPTTSTLHFFQKKDNIA